MQLCARLPHSPPHSPSRIAPQLVGDADTIQELEDFAELDAFLQGRSVVAPAAAPALS